MMRTLTGLMVALTLGLASAATATSLTVDTDKKTYLGGETITVTTTLVVMAGHSSQNQLLLQLLWSDPQILGTPGPTTVDTIARMWCPGQSCRWVSRHARC